MQKFCIQAVGAIIMKAILNVVGFKPAAGFFNGCRNF